MTEAFLQAVHGVDELLNVSGGNYEQRDLTGKLFWCWSG